VASECGLLEMLVHLFALFHGEKGSDLTSRQTASFLGVGTTDMFESTIDFPTSCGG